jgi:hypothetical protein
MTRLLFGLYGAGLLLVWLVAMLSGASHWLRWADFVTGSFSFVVALSPVFTGTLGRRDSAGYAWALSGVLFVLFIAELAVGATSFLTWTSLLFSLLYAGGALILGRSDIKLPEERII